MKVNFQAAIKDVTSREKRFWLILLISSFIGIMLMLISTYAIYNFSGNTTSKNSYRVNWKEYLMLPFYFTFISNVFGLVVSILSLTLKQRHEIIWFERVKIMMVVNLVITLLVYWGILSKSANWHSSINVAQNMFVHLFTPLFSVLAFTMEIFLRKEKAITIWKTVGWNFFMPAIWLVVVLILYAALGANGKEDSPYPFLNIAHNKWYSSFGYILGIGFIYVLFTWIATFVYTKKWWAKHANPHS